METLEGAMINGRQVQVSLNFSVASSSNEETFGVVCVRNLPQSISTDEAFVALMEQFGQVKSAKMQISRAGNRFGVCDYANPEDAAHAIEALHEKVIDGQALFCDRFKRRDSWEREARRRAGIWHFDKYEEWKGRYLYVRGFARTASEEQVKQIFQEFGEVEGVKLVRDEFGEPRGFAYVCFTERAAAERCLEESVFRTVPDTGKQLFVAELVPGERRNRSGPPTRENSMEWVRVRQEILDETEGPTQAKLLWKLKWLSEDQALRLTRNQNLLVRWMSLA
jgi:polyadenylate-binding protein